MILNLSQRNFENKHNYSHNRGLIGRLFIVVILLIFVLLFLPTITVFKKSFQVGCQFSIILGVSLFNVYHDLSKRSYSLNLMHWLYILIFLCCAGIVQYATGTFLWNFHPTTEEIVRANYLVIFWCLSYSLAHHFITFGNKSLILNSGKIQNIVPGKEKDCYSFFAFAFLVVLIVLSILSIAFIPLSSFFNRDAFNNQSIVNRLSSSSSIRLVLNSLIRGLSLWVTLYFLNKYKTRKSFASFILFLISLFSCFVLVPPFGVARYVFAATYGSIVLFYFDVFKRKNYFIYIFLIGLLFVFPLLNSFRYYSSQYTTSSFLDNVGTIASNFSRADYDSYTMLIYTLRYCDSFSVSYGKQLLSVAFFFLPSNLWTTKSIGSGAMIIESFDTSIPSNVSCPLIGEGYINFGLFGVLGFSVLLSFIIKYADDKYWSNKRSHSIWYCMLYCFAIFFLVFTLRGDLLSTYSFFVGYAISLLIVYILTDYIPKKALF